MKAQMLARFRLVPPLWLMLALAAVVAAALLAAFIDTLHDTVRRGEALRQGQRAGAARHMALTAGVSSPVTPSGAPQALTLQP